MTPVIALTSSSLICNGANAILSASTTATSYTWSNGSTSSTINVTPATTTIYSLTVRNNNGCNAFSTVAVNVNACTGIEESAMITNLISIYPNPSNGIFYIDLNETSTLIISNSLGQLLFTEILENGKQIIDLRNQTNGLYFVKIIQNNKEQSIRIIKE